jgi:hypothetical protein
LSSRRGTGLGDTSDCNATLEAVDNIRVGGSVVRCVVVIEIVGVVGVSSTFIESGLTS